MAHFQLPFIVFEKYGSFVQYSSLVEINTNLNV